MQVEIICKLRRYLTQLQNINLIVQLAEEEETKKNPEQKNGSFLIEMISDNGTQKINDLSYGISTTEEKILGSTSEFFR